MKTTTRKIGNSQGVLIPQPLLAQVGLEGEAEMSVEKDTIVIRTSRRAPRADWVTAAQRIVWIAALDPSLGFEIQKTRLSIPITFKRKSGFV